MRGARRLGLQLPDTLFAYNAQVRHVYDAVWRTTHRYDQRTGRCGGNTARCVHGTGEGRRNNNHAC